MKIDFASYLDIDSWMILVDKVKDLFPGLEMDEHRKTVIEFIENAILKSLPKEVLTQEELKEINRRRNIKDTTRYSVLERAGFKCQCCGIKPLKNNDVILHIDHIIPYSLGGSDNIDNLQVLCNKCNISKRNKFIINHNVNWVEEA